MLYAGVWPNIGRALLFFGVVFTFWSYYYGLRGLVLQYLVGGRGAGFFARGRTDALRTAQNSTDIIRAPKSYITPRSIHTS